VHASSVQYPSGWQVKPEPQGRHWQPPMH
jgi:hypothetical protein